MVPKILRFWRYLAPKIWNALPEALKHEIDLSSFKRRVKRKKENDVIQLHCSVNSFIIVIIELFIVLFYFILFTDFYVVD